MSSERPICAGAVSSYDPPVPRFPTSAVLAAVSAVVLTLTTACSGRDSSSPTPASTTSSSAQSSAAASQPKSTQSTAARAPRTVSGKELGKTVSALDTVYSCETGDQGARFHVFDPQSGAFADFADPLRIPAGSSLHASQCALTGSPSQLQVMYLWEYLTPAAGLTPATTTRLGVVRGIHDQAPPAPTDLTAVVTSLQPLWASDGGPVMSPAPWNCKEGPACTVAFRPGSLDIAWTDPRAVSFSSRDSVEFQDIKAGTMTVRNVGSKADVTYADTRVAESQGGGIGITSRGYMLMGANSGFFNSRTMQLIPYPSDSLAYFQNTFQGDRVLSWLKADQYFLTVMNIDSGAVDFHLGEQEMKTLDGRGFAMFDDYLYVQNSNDSPVLDMKTRQRVNVGWKVRPIQWINPHWLLVSHTPNSTQWCYERGAYACDDDVTLEFQADGRYSGPRY